MPSISLISLQIMCSAPTYHNILSCQRSDDTLIERCSTSSELVLVLHVNIGVVFGRYT